MVNSEQRNHLFQVGMILGRITQFSIDRAVVIPDNGVGLADFLSLLSEEISKLPLSEQLTKKILEESNNLVQTIHGYEKGKRLEPDDARVMVSFVSRWTDLIYDEFGKDRDNQEGRADIPKNIDRTKEKPGTMTKKATARSRNGSKSASAGKEDGSSDNHG